MLLADNKSSPLRAWQYFTDYRSTVLGELWSHAWLSALPVVVGLALALPLGYLARRYSWTYPPMVTISGLLYTIPSIALFVTLPQILHTKILSPVNVAVALTIYTVALLVRVVADGLASVPDAVTQAATAMGYRRFGRLIRIELPIAVPVIAAGLRVAAVSNVSMVSIAGTVGVSNLGGLFTVALQRSVDGPYYPPIVLGLVLCVLLAVALDVLIVVVARMFTPWRRAVAAR
jgi:osmoprotectant transport system permease protein